MKGMCNNRISGANIENSMKAIYLLWAIWIIGHLSITLYYIYDISLTKEDWSWSHSRNMYLFWSINGLILSLATGSWMISRKIVRRNLVSDYKNADDIQLDDFSRRMKVMYILPFACASMNIITIPTFVILGITQLN